MKRLMLPLVGALFLSACGQYDKKLDSVQVPAGATLQPIVLKAPDYSLMSDGTALSWALLGPLGAAGANASATSNGADLVRQADIKNPAIHITGSLAKKLRQKYKMKLTSEEPVMSETYDGEIIRKMHKDSDYLLETYLEWGTKGGSITGGVSVYNTFSILLLRTESGEVLSRSTCRQSTDHTYGLNELRDNNAAKLKKLITEAADTCLAQFSEALGVK